MISSSAEPAGLTSSPERRLIRDRRTRPTPVWDFFRLGGRRSGFRRAGEGRDAYVDRPSGEVVALCLLTVILSVLDALFTLLHLEGGGREVNPFMRLVLDAGVSWFVSLKIGLTAVGVMFLAVHQNFRMSRVALHGIALVYSVLLAYHSVLYIAARI